MQRREVKAFKYELRNYNFYCQELKEKEELIEYLYDRLGGVRGVDPSKEPLHSAPNKEYEYMLRDKISKVEQKKVLLEHKIDYIDQILGNVETPLKSALKSVYINGEKLDKVSQEFFLTPNGLIYRLNKAIEEALK